jgi:hypothetical protein
MTIDWLNDNSSSGGDGVDRPGVYFATVGSKVVGTIIGTPRQVDTQYGERLIIDVRAIEGTTATKGKLGADGPIAVGEEVSIWAKAGAMAAALRDAINQADAKGFTEGDTLALACSEEIDTGKHSKLKKYVARYTPAAPAVNLESLV